MYFPPEAANGGINIPWFVSHGYIVCTPDINKKIGKPGMSAYNSVMGLVGKLKEMPFIDTTKMGLLGHSYGGYQVNYLVTRTKAFAAAYAGSATSDMISSYGALRGEGTSNSFPYEYGQYYMGKPIWQNVEGYIENSPIFKADKVTTPMLLMNNKADGSVPFAQGLQFYLALSRLSRPVWLLQYEGEGHTIETPSNQIDFTIKTMEFFDHFLKDKPLPGWMDESAKGN